MDFEAVKIGNNIHASVNGVVSAAFARQCVNGEWAIMVPQIAYSVPTKEEAARRIARAMDIWYTSAQAAERLVELGAYDSPPSAHTMSNLARAGAFPGAFKLLGRGSGEQGKGGGQGGSWRIPEAGLQTFAERRKR